MDPVIGIIGGKGEMGQLFASFFKERGVKVLISDIKTKLTNKELAKKSDITIMSVPIDKTEKVIKEVIPHIKEGAAIMDFTSVKQMPVKEMLKGKCEVMGIHPMFGSTNPIPGQTIILCPTKKSNKWSKWIESFFKNHNVKLLKMTPKEHDKTMGIAQGLIHFADIAFMDGLKRVKMPVTELFKYTSRSSELKVMMAARLIDQDSGLYGNIQIANPVTPKFLRQYKKSIDELIKIVEKKDLKKFKKYFDDARKFTGKYSKEALGESAYLIDKLLEKRRRPKSTTKKTRPTKASIALLGPANTFSDIAASRYLKDSKQKLKKYFAKNIEEVFELVASGKVKEGIVPIENTLHGTVRETIDGLFEKNVHIEKEIRIPIHHCLIALESAKAKDIKEIISHQQPLSQCKKYLNKNFAKALQQPFSSTAASVEKLLTKNKTSVAVIASQDAGNRKELKILAKNIEDEKDNTTTFVVIKKGKAPKPKATTNKQNKKTSIAFHFSNDSAGSLSSVFQDFSNAKINLTRIESRPTQEKYGRYIFYLDFEGSLYTPKIQKVIKRVEKKVAKLKVLGSY